MLKIPCTRIAAGMLAVAATAGIALAQAAKPASSPLSFEVASIKAAPPLDIAAIASGKLPHLGMSVDNDRVDIGGLPLLQLICMAYKVKPNQVAGNPEWLSAGMNDNRFDILAKIPEGANKDQVPEMLQALLAERFKLAVHREKRDTPGYALVVGKGGPKLKEADPDPPAPAPAAVSAASSSGEASGTGRPGAAKPAGANGEMSFGSGNDRVTVKQSKDGMVLDSKTTGRMRIMPREDGAIRMEFESMTMASFAAALSDMVGSPVVDMTELKGKYKVVFELHLDALMAQQGMGMDGMGLNMGAEGAPGLPADSATDPSGNSFLASLQPLGLKLERRKLPYDFVVVEHVEKTPTEN
jgi:uncharacterized protein (TIGR03435 family)